jgi:hypothetical protein
MNTVPELSQKDINRKMPFVLGILGLLMIILAFTIGISDNIPGILLLLIGSFILLYAFLYRLGGTRNLSPSKKLLYWTPRALCIVFIILTSFFALDVFGESKSIWETILALLMHLIPTFVLVVVLVITWRREWIGGILFNFLAILYVVWAWGRFPLATYLLMAGPLIVIGMLFFLNWKYREDLRPSRKA